MSIAICTGEGKLAEHCPLELRCDSGQDVPIIAEQRHGEYVITNRYADGIVGVSDEDMTEAEVDEQPLCGDCGSLIDHWEHELWEHEQCGS